MKRAAAAAFALLVLFGVGRTVSAADVSIALTPKPYFAGVPIEIQLSATGFAKGPEPLVEYDKPTGGTLLYDGASSQVSNTVQIINGRISRSNTVRWVFGFRFVAGEAGAYSVGPFVIRQGNADQVIRAVRITVSAIPLADEHRVHLEIPEGPHYVGERIPVKLTWAVVKSRNDRIVERSIRVPLFDRIGDFTFLPVNAPEANELLILQTAQGRKEFPATATLRNERGKRWLVATIDQILVPLKEGEFAIAPATVVFKEGVRFRRDLFGSSVPTQTLMLRATDEPQTLVVSAQPSKGRPASFAGAVGEGMSIEVTANPTVVQVGDPVKLTMTLHGSGPLRSIAFPALGDAIGLPSSQFRAPPGKLAGTADGNSKRFEASVRVLDSRVTEIPPLAYSWFDTKLGKYQTTYSKPIALSVREAQVVSAADVVTATPAAEREENAESDTAASPRMPAAAVPFTLTGADLSIATATDILGRSRNSPLASPIAIFALYLGGIVLIGAAVIARRRLDEDPSVLRRRLLIETELRALSGASSAADIAGALRRLRAEIPGFGGDEYDRLLERCDSVAFARNGDAASLDDELRSAAVAIAKSWSTTGGSR